MTMVHMPPQPITSFITQKFCTKLCANEHGIRYRGEANSLWKGDNARRANRRGVNNRWNMLVLQRDRFTCQKCERNDQDISYNAHHIRPVEFFPKERNNVENGVTLCSECHWEVHVTLDPKFIEVPEEVKNSRTRRVKAIKLDGNVTSATNKNKTSRTWRGNCFWCAEEISKRLSDVSAKSAVFCSRSCASKHTKAFSTYRPTNRANLPDTVRPPFVGEIASLKDGE